MADTFSNEENHHLGMSGREFEIGNDVAFCGGEGEVVGHHGGGQVDIIKIQTSSGEVRTIPTDIESLKSVS